MAQRFWVGGTGNWDATTTNWSASSGGAGGASVPTSADDVIFDSLSNATAYTCTLTTTPVCKSITVAGPASGNVTIAGSTTFNISGSFTLAATGVTWTNTSSINLIGGAGSVLTTSGISLTNILTLLPNSIYTLGSALTNSSGININGSFNTANYNLTCGGTSLGINVASTHTISFGSSIINVPTINFSLSTGLTFNAGTSQINCSLAAATFQGGGQTYYNVSFTSTAHSGLNIFGTNTFNNLIFARNSTASLSSISIANNQTINGTLTFATPTNIGSTRDMITSGTYGTPITITANAVSLTEVDFRDITGAGTAIWTGTRLGDCGGNSNITFPAPKNVYWNLATGGNWSISAWATTGGGTPALANFPLPQDTAIFQSTGLNSGATVTINSSYNIGTIDMSARTSNTMTLASSTLSPNIFGNWINGTGTTTSGAGTLTLLGRNKTQTITSAGKTFTQSITTNAIGGTVTLADNFSTSTSITLTNGTLNLAGFTAATPTFVTAAGTKNITFNGGTLAISGVTTTAFNNAIPTGFTTTAGTGTGVINMTGTSAKTFVGGGTTYNCTLNQGGLGALTVSGDNTFYNITNTVQPSTITFAASSTNIVANFGLKGTSGNLITLNSSISGTKFNLIKSGTNVISADYLSIRDSSVTPVSHMWYAGANSTNVSNNTGWLFKPFRSGNNMLMW